MHQHLLDGHHGLRISRRAFVGRSSLSVTVHPPTFTSWDLGFKHPGESTKPEPRLAFAQNPDLLLSVKETARWIDSARQQDSSGIHWLPEPDHPEKSVTVSAANTIYSGSAGTILFFIQLAEATGEAQYLEAAAQGADYLAATWQDLTVESTDDTHSASSQELSFYHGLAGAAFVLNEAGKATGDSKYRDASRAATDHIVQTARTVGSGVAWSDRVGISADGGIVLYLLYAAREFSNEKYRDIAVRAGDRILEQATRQRNGGFSWRSSSCYEELTREVISPNFENGTAGVAYMFARLFSETNRAKYLYAAKQGALHLQTIATLHGNAALIPYRLPDLPDLYYLGFCHGPAGTARTFFELHRITREPVYQEWAERLVQGIIQSGIPENQTPGYWNVVCQCCGSAAVIDLFVGLWSSTGRASYLDFAQRVSRQLLSRTSDPDGKGSRWYQSWTRIKPWEIRAETGYSIGASGVGCALLHLHLAEQGRYRAIHFPDNPFASERHEEFL